MEFEKVEFFRRINNKWLSLNLRNDNKENWSKELTSFGLFMQNLAVRTPSQECCSKCYKENIIMGQDELPEGKIWCADCKCHSSLSTTEKCENCGSTDNVIEYKDYNSVKRKLCNPCAEIPVGEFYKKGI